MGRGRSGPYASLRMSRWLRNQERRTGETFRRSAANLAAPEGNPTLLSLAQLSHWSKRVMMYTVCYAPIPVFSPSCLPLIPPSSFRLVLSGEPLEHPQLPLGLAPEVGGPNDECFIPGMERGRRVTPAHSRDAAHEQAECQRRALIRNA